MRRGFTLVELSIVLVIIGLLVGGVLVGQALIRAAELRAVTSEYDKYSTALATFYGKYNGLPGDLKNAVRFWGAAAGGTAEGIDGTCLGVTTAATGTETCNGNGDGRISYRSYNDYALYPHEGARAWQQLANAGLVAGKFSGVYGATGWGFEPGVNMPKSKFSSGSWSIAYLPGRNRESWAPPKEGHYINIGGATGTSPGDGYWFNPILLPLDAYSIDVKIDDGKPHEGNTVNIMTGGYWCASVGPSGTIADGEYNITDASQQPLCVLLMRSSL